MQFNLRTAGWIASAYLIIVGVDEIVFAVGTYSAGDESIVSTIAGLPDIGSIAGAGIGNLASIGGILDIVSGGLILLVLAA